MQEDHYDPDDHRSPNDRVWELLHYYKFIKMDMLHNGNLKSKHWLQIVEKVNRNRESLLTVKQIKNKLYYLRKKFMIEKKKQNTTGSTDSTWEYYDVCYDLFGTSNKIIGVPNGVDNGTSSESVPIWDLNSSPSSPSTAQSSARTVHQVQEESNATEPGLRSPRAFLDSPRINHIGVTGQLSRRYKTSSSSMAAALDRWTENYTDLKKRKLANDERRTLIMEKLLELKTKELFGDRAE